MKDSFSTYHPIVNFSYFALVMLFSMFLTHPVCLGLSLAAAFFYIVYLNGKKAVIFSLKFMLPMLLITAAINPLFNHEGITILTYLYDGNPVTLESVSYGIAAAVMLVTVMFWFSCFNFVISSDKFVYLFGRIIPSLSLIFSMAMRFVPRFKAQLAVVSNAQKCIGKNRPNDRLFSRIRQSVKILSIMVTWVLENGIETVDSMKSRGYGLKGRTAFSIYRFDSRDRLCMMWIILLGGYVLLGWNFKTLYFRYFPSMKGAADIFSSLSSFAVYGVLLFMPLAINLREDRKWKLLQSRI